MALNVSLPPDVAAEVTHFVDAAGARWEPAAVLTLLAQVRAVCGVLQVCSLTIGGYNSNYRAGVLQVRSCLTLHWEVQLQVVCGGPCVFLLVHCSFPPPALLCSPRRCTTGCSALTKPCPSQRCLGYALPLPRKQLKTRPSYSPTASRCRCVGGN